MNENVITYAEFQYRREDKKLERCRRTLQKATELERQLFSPHLESFIENHKNSDKGDDAA